mgnify:FL=1
MRIIENILAAVGLVALAYFGALGLLSMEKQTVPEQFAQTTMQHPMLCDATVKQGIHYERLGKPKCYVRGNQ